MAGYKSSGGWMDVTSNVRNEVVFEGRNKDYGAYFVRKNYRHAVFLALGIATTVVVISIGVPLILKILNVKKVEEEKNVIITLINPPPVTPKTLPPPPPPPPKLPPPKTPLNSTLKVTPPIIANIPDSIATAKDISKTPVGTDTKIGKDPDIISPPITPSLDVPKGNSGEVFMVVEVEPHFPGDINQWLNDHIQYPEQATETGLQGIVYVSFVVETNGSVSQIKILRGVSSALDDEAKRVVGQMPPWTPGQQNGHTVRVQFQVPIHFILR